MLELRRHQLRARLSVSVVEGRTERSGFEPHGALVFHALPTPSSEGRRSPWQRADDSEPDPEPVSLE